MADSESITLDGAKTDSQLHNITASYPTATEQDLFSHACTTEMHIHGSVYNLNVNSGAGQQNVKVEEGEQEDGKDCRCEKCVWARRGVVVGGLPEEDMWRRDEGARLTGGGGQGESERKVAQRLAEEASGQSVGGRDGGVFVEGISGGFGELGRQICN